VAVGDHVQVTQVRVGPKHQLHPDRLALIGTQRVEQVVPPQVVRHALGEYLHHQAGRRLLRPAIGQAPGERVQDVHDRGRDADPAAVAGL
jgi:hypothetical protein